MAKTKVEKEAALAAETNVVEETKVETEIVEEVKAEPKAVSVDSNTTAKPGPSYDELLSIVQTLAAEVQTLKSGQAQAPKNNNEDLATILAALTNRKSDREVSIVHNAEYNGGLTTHIDLSNISIDFSHVGETRLLSWQQFEELASKYRSFFDRKLILVAGEYADVAEQYSLPCAATQKHLLTQKDIAKLPNLSVPELESFIDSLSDEDKDTVFSYWLGKCYTREPGFYDRHKMDTLNRLSDGAFDNVLLVMNGDGRSIPTTKQK